MCEYETWHPKEIYWRIANLIREYEFLEEDREFYYFYNREDFSESEKEGKQVEL